jgi:hypothetical protein
VAKDGSGEPPSSGRNGEHDFHGEKRSNVILSHFRSPGHLPLVCHHRTGESTE